ncbi:MAG: hypothetical protein AB1540_01755 [Bdellovibrionota bacterium]
MNSARTEMTADPIAVFLAGVFVGFTVGPQLVHVARLVIQARAIEIAQTALDRLVTVTNQGLSGIQLAKSRENYPTGE